MQDYESEEESLQFSTVDHATFDYEYSPADPVQIHLSPSDLPVIDIMVELEAYEYGDEDESGIKASIQQLLAPLLVRRRATFVKAEVDDMSAAAPILWHVMVQPAIRVRTVGDLYNLGCEVEMLVRASQGVGLSRATLLDIVRSGRSDVLIGLEEGHWLEVKSQAYDLSGTSGKIKFAQTIARFANAETGGLVIFGMRTKGTPNGEVISAVSPLQGPRPSVRQVRHCLDAHVYPPPDHLNVEEVPQPAGRLIVIDIPPQPEELKPFLVHGAIVDGEVEGAFISIVRRRGEGSIPITAASIHTSLVAGRALLRRGELPADPQTGA